MKWAEGGSAGFERWLLWSLPPLSGRLRAVFYGGSLVLFAFLNGGLDFTLRDASPHLYQPRGLTAWLGVPYLSPTGMRTLMAATYIAWLCAAAGLFTRPAKILTAVGFFLAVGFEQAFETGSNHTHYLLLYCLLVLCFSTSDGEWSLDAWLRRRRGVTDEAQSGLGSTGLPRHAILILVAALYFSSGLSKLMEAGPQWADGRSLQYYIGSQVDRTSFELVTSLRIWVSGQRWLCQILSMATLVIELGAPVALFSLRLRHVLIPSWIAMHFGIVLLMAPNYWIHSWCVGVLLTDWAWLKRVWETRSFPGRERTRVEPVGAAAGRPARVRVLGAALILFAFVPPVAQIEWFPLTHIPMYSSYVTPEVIAGIPVEDFGDEARVRDLARGCTASRAIGYPRRCPWRVPRAIIDRVTLSLTGPDVAQDSLTTGDIGGLRYPVIERLAATTAQERSESTAELVDRVRALLRAQPDDAVSGYDRFRLEYRLSGSTILLADDDVVVGP